MIVVDFIIMHDKIILLIGTWRTTRENSATTRVEWDALGWLIRKLVRDDLTRKGQAGSESM
jgi:YD repeat-containing protein